MAIFNHSPLSHGVKKGDKWQVRKYMYYYVNNTFRIWHIFCQKRKYIKKKKTIEFSFLLENKHLRINIRCLPAWPTKMESKLISLFEGKIEFRLDIPQCLDIKIPSKVENRYF